MNKKEKSLILINKITENIIENNKKLEELENLMWEICDIDKNMTKELSKKFNDLSFLLENNKESFDYYSDIFEFVEENEKIESINYKQKILSIWIIIIIFLILCWIYYWDLFLIQKLISYFHH